jgi:D-3-phosphoglycerate dehydrogenase / 2-oxoglutarate reductase
MPARNEPTEEHQHMHKIIVGGRIHPSGISLLEARNDFDVEVLADSTADTLAANMGEAEAVLARMQIVSREMIESAPSLKVVSRNGVGWDTVDVDACSERGIPLTVVGDVNSTSVAEHTLMMILATAKRVIGHDACVREDRWSFRDGLLASDIEGRTLFIVGFGRIGRKVAARARGFEMDILVHDPFLTADQIEAAGVRAAESFEAGLAEADYVTLHAPGSGDGRPLIGAHQLSLMKPTAVIINTSRGSHIDEAALAAAISDGKLGGAGLDVFQPEPPQAGNPLYELDTVVLSPHIAGFTRDCAERMAKHAAPNIIDAIDGKLNPERVVNADRIGLK